jgi:soluble lytic murein transglycosylase-like protein
MGVTEPGQDAHRGPGERLALREAREAVTMEIMRTYRRWLIQRPRILWLVGALILGLMAGLTMGSHWQHTREVAAQVDQTLTERAVLEYVIQRAPDARLRDFMDFPKVLLEQSAKANVDFRLILSVAVVESDLQASAVSPKGARGFLQLMPRTAKAVAEKNGLPWSAVALDDPKYNVRLSILYLKDQIEYFNDLKASLRAYNEGPGKVVPQRRQTFYPYRDSNTTQYVMAVALAHLETTAWFSRRGILTERTRKMGQPTP